MEKIKNNPFAFSLRSRLFQIKIIPNKKKNVNTRKEKYRQYE